MKTILRLLTSKPVAVVAGILTVFWIGRAVIKSWRHSACLEPYKGRSSKRAYCAEWEKSFADLGYANDEIGQSDMAAIRRECESCPKGIGQSLLDVVAGGYD